MPTIFDPTGLYDNPLEQTGDGNDDPIQATVRNVHASIVKGFARRLYETSQPTPAASPGQFAGNLSSALGDASNSIDGYLATAKSAMAAGAAVAPKVVDLIEKGNTALSLGAQGLQVWSDIQKGQPWDDAVVSGLGRLGADTLGGIEGGLLAGAAGSLGGPVGSAIATPFGAFAGALGTEKSKAADEAGEATQAAYDELKRDWSF